MIVDHVVSQRMHKNIETRAIEHQPLKIAIIETYVHERKGTAIGFNH